MRWLILICGMALLAQANAQVDSSLTREFAGLSAKERNRLAKKEQDEARNDATFNAVMNEADALFQGQRFEEALAKYKEARRLRPLNVYPKVKIQDLQAHLDKQRPVPFEPDSALVAKPEPIETQRFPVVEESATLPPKEEVQQSSASPLPEPENTPARTRPVEAAKAHSPNEVHQVRAPQQEHQVPLEEGMTERSFMEGRAVVLERNLVRDGLLTVYRKVAHPWGQVVHFRDGQAISEREWIEAFTPR